MSTSPGPEAQPEPARGPAQRVLLAFAGMTGGGPPPSAVRRVVEGRVVVVTGASRGIGAEVAWRAAACGAEVVLVARGVEDLTTVAGRIRRTGGRARVLVADLRDTDAAGRAGETVLADHGTPVVLLQGAGHSIHRSLAATTDRFHDVRRLAGVNYLGPVALALPLLAAMRDVGSGHLIALSSASALVPAPGWSSYGASKAAHDAWLRSVHAELSPDGVATTTIRLPLVHTAMSAPTYAGRAGMSVADAADWVCRAIVERPRTITPWWIRLGAHVALAAPGLTERAAGSSSPRPPS
ncbi:epimerase [Serinibacter arcticus]|uniref:Epimerase n=1 Tax=Serinibacter arcticus TaxID=1655435 RepID=A0A2U1ZY80_9MICO|nr:SDR family NAD(P)-dependent oxidoreductase [Serinibacter arcticus]PWD51948.1 epimerase [Serinibacter arcticus]